jgi:hypothetical protein
MKLKNISLLMATGALLIPVLLVAQDSQPSLADVVRQKSSTKAKKVITDEDMPSTSNPSPATAPASGSTSGSGASASASTDSAANSKSGAPGGKLADLQKQLDDINHDESLLNKKLEQLQQKIEIATDPFRKKLYQDSIDNQQTTLSEFRKKRQELEQQITDEKSKAKS